MGKICAYLYELGNKQISVRDIINGIRLILAVVSIGVGIFVDVFLFHCAFIIRPEGLAIYGSDGKLVNHPYASGGAYCVNEANNQPLWLIPDTNKTQLFAKNANIDARYVYQTNDNNIDIIALQLDPDLKPEFKVYFAEPHLSFNWLGQRIQHVNGLTLRDSFQIACLPVVAIAALIVLIITIVKIYTLAIICHRRVQLWRQIKSGIIPPL